MEEKQQDKNPTVNNKEEGLRSVVEETIRECLNSERMKEEPAYKIELAEERRRREQLERRVNELVSENERTRSQAEEAERSAAIRDELRRLGVTKVDLGYRAVKDDVYRAEDGSLVARGDDGEVTLGDYLTKFTQENPELLPARISGGSGAPSAGAEGLIATLDAIRPGMDAEERRRVRSEIADAISQVRKF